MATSVPEVQHGVTTARSIAGATATVLLTVRAPALAFSLPYLWVWTEGLDGIVRACLMVAHAGTLLAIATTSVSADMRRGLTPRLGLLRGTRWTRPELVDPCAQMLTLLAIAGIAALATAPAGMALPLVVAALLVGGLLWAHTPPSFKYLALPEWGGAFAVLAAPAAAIWFTTPASPSWRTVLAGAAFLAALTLATHLRDRTEDLAADVPTAATRQPAATRRWVWSLAGVGALGILAGIHVPLSLLEWAGIAGSLAFVGAVSAWRVRVPLMAAAHGVVALYLLFAA